VILIIEKQTIGNFQLFKLGKRRDPSEENHSQNNHVVQPCALLTGPDDKEQIER